MWNSISQGHFALTIEVLEKSSKADEATRRGRLGETPLLSHAAIQCSISCDSEAAPTLLFLSELPPEVDEVLGLEPDFIAVLDDQGDELVCSLGSFQKWR